jgi:hypothetical protein
MQATVVSKRPSKGLLIAIAAVLGLVSVGAVFAPSFLKNDLAHNGTYVQLLGYTPGQGGSSLTAQSVQSSQSGQLMIESARPPATTPAPPAVTAQAGAPTTPQGSTVAPAPTSQSNPNPVGTDNPAAREINGTEANLTSDPIGRFGLGVVPSGETNVTGATDVSHFIDPHVNESSCTWTKEVTYVDANHDGHPEYVHVKMLGTCSFDDGAVTVTVARDIQAWDNDSSGVFNALEVRQGEKVTADPANGTYEYRAQAVWTLSVKDPDEDGKPNYVYVTFAGEQDFDRNANGNAEFVRTVTGHMQYVDNLSADIPNGADVALRIYQTYDIHDDGGKEYQGLLAIHGQTVDADHDGINETSALSAMGYEVLDANRDGRSELAHGFELSANRTIGNASNPASQADAWVYLYATEDPTSTGVSACRAALELHLLATDANNDGHPEFVEATVRGAVLRDANQDGMPELNASLAGSFRAYDNDSNGIFEKAVLHLQAQVTVDADSDGVPEAVAYATLDIVVLNTIQDDHPDRIDLHYIASETLDLNDDGVMGETRGATVDAYAIDANSNGHFEVANLTARASDVIDTNHDGIPEYQASFDAYVQVKDLNDDGHPEYVNVTARGSEVAQAENGTPEFNASFVYTARFVDADSDGVFENVTITYRAEKTVYGPNGQIVSQEWITYDYSGQDLNADGTMDNVSVVLQEHIKTYT